MGANELKHYGVRGMKWGVRRYGSALGQSMADGALHPRAQSQAFRESMVGQSFGTRLRRATLYSNTKEIEAVNARTKQIVAERKMKSIETSRQKKFSSMTPEQKAAHANRVTLMVANGAMAGVNLALATRKSNPIRYANALVGTANLVTAAALARQKD